MENKSFFSLFPTCKTSVNNHTKVLHQLYAFGTLKQGCSEVINVFFFARRSDISLEKRVKC